MSSLACWTPSAPSIDAPVQDKYNPADAVLISRKLLLTRVELPLWKASKETPVLHDIPRAPGMAL